MNNANIYIIYQKAMQHGKDDMKSRHAKANRQEDQWDQGKSGERGSLSHSPSLTRFPSGSPQSDVVSEQLHDQGRLLDSH